MTSVDFSSDAAVAIAPVRIPETQVIVESTVGSVVMTVEGSPTHLEELIRNVLSDKTRDLHPDLAAGSLLRAITEDPELGPGMGLSCEYNWAAPRTIWLQHRYPDTWLIARGPQPDRLSWSEISGPAGEFDAIS